MKKSLVLAMAMALGVTASAYAANPFSDVPAGHWAYDSVNKLAAAGIVDGYGNGTFGGDRLMTRYEMAQIVAKAMAKGANVDRLAAEFADELDSLGVRVAALEKKSDNVKITGISRYLLWSSILSHSSISWKYPSSDVSGVLISCERLVYVSAISSSFFLYSFLSFLRRSSSSFNLSESSPIPPISISR